MIYAMREILKSNSNLIEKLGGVKIYPNYATVSGPCIVYTNYPEEVGKVNTNRYEVKVICSDYDLLEELSQEVLNSLAFKESAKAYVYDNVVIYNSELSGGGTLDYEDLGYTERVLYFNVKWRRK